MPSSPQAQPVRRSSRPRRDWGRTFARLFCLIFALIGAVPLTGGLLLRSEPLQNWAADETSRLLREQLGVEATFSVELSLIPLRLAVTGLQVPATDGGSPALRSELIAVSPRFFSLLAGRIDVGDIEIEDTAIRLVIEGEEIKNVAFRFPDTSSDGPELNRAPFRSLALTNASLDLVVDDKHIVTDAIDIDAITEKDLAFDVALHLAGARLHSQRSPEEEAGPQESTLHDDDRICELDLRVFLSKEEVLVRRLSLLAALDQNPAPETAPSCDELEDERVALRLSQFKITPQKSGAPHLRGHAMTRVPLAVVNRFTTGLDASGWIGFSGDITLNGESRLPEVNGRLSGDKLKIVGKRAGDKLSAQVLVNGDVIQVPQLQASWANGQARIEGVRIAPFEKGIPLSVDKIYTKEIDLPGVLSSIDVTQHAWVDWNFGDTEVTKIRGTVSPFYLDGGVAGKTHDFMVWDRGFDDPAHVPMLGLKNANITGRFRATQRGLEFYSCDVRFGSSQLPVELVALGLDENPLIVRLEEQGGEIDLADISPIAAIDLEGRAKLFVDLKGPMTHPALNGTLSVEDFVIEGFEAGNITESQVYFEPLFVEFSELKGERNALAYTLPQARLSFDGPAGVEFTADLKSSSFDVQEFLQVFHFDEDPRFAALAGRGIAHGSVRYLLGGPEDTCEGGRLTVEGSTRLKDVSLLGESYSEAESRFFLEWFDMEAGIRGTRLDVQHLTLRKGSGSIFGSVRLDAGGVLQGDLIGTRIPVSRVNALGELFRQTDGFITGTGRLGGTAENLAFSADLNVTRLKAGQSELGPSSITVELVPPPYQEDTSAGFTACGRAIPPPLSPGQSPQAEGSYLIAGELFGGQIAIKHLEVDPNQKLKLSGLAELKNVDLEALSSFTPLALTKTKLGSSSLSGSVNVTALYPEDLFASEARLNLSAATFKADQLELALEGNRTAIILEAGKIRSEHLALAATTNTGHRGVLDGELTINRDQQIVASLDLRPTDLGVLAAALPGVTRAQGGLSASFSLSGALAQPQFGGFIEVEQGEVQLAEISTPITELDLTVALDGSGLRVVKGEGNWGGGSLRLAGEAPLSQGRLGRTDLSFTARNVALPIARDFNVKFDADLKLNVPPPSSESQQLPRLTGRLNVLAASYEKAMSVTADLADLTSRGTRTEVSDYDESKNSLQMDVLLTSSQPLRVKNDLVEATLMIDPAGLRISGTDQQYGAVGTVEIESGGQVFLRRNEFEVQGGLVRFNDPTRLRPEVDVTALTEYRRYEDRGATQGDAVTADSASSSNSSGNWRIMMRAYGPPENLKVDLTSDPPLAQDDIFLLLTVGLTRTELDQTSNSSVGSSVALEALGSLSGAESAVTETVPVDEFRFGSAYSSRSGRTEPTVTIGKRLSRRMRASVTTSLSDSTEVHSNVEYRATDSLSVEGSYANAGNAASAAGGNLGGDVRWRVEFK